MPGLGGASGSRRLPTRSFRCWIGWWHGRSTPPRTSSRFPRRRSSRPALAARAASALVLARRGALARPRGARVGHGLARRQRDRGALQITLRGRSSHDGGVCAFQSSYPSGHTLRSVLLAARWPPSGRGLPLGRRLGGRVARAARGRPPCAEDILAGCCSRCWPGLARAAVTRGPSSSAASAPELFALVAFVLFRVVREVVDRRSSSACRPCARRPRAAARDSRCRARASGARRCDRAACSPHRATFSPPGASLRRWTASSLRSARRPSRSFLRFPAMWSS